MPKTNNLKNIVYDEFYTRLEDIATGSSAYNHFFKGKTIYCNCDDYAKSNFVRYFRYNFQKLGLKKLISTSYNAAGQGIFYSYNGTTSRTKALDGNGDFRSTECIKLLKQADIVVTNPPFSLFREYISMLYRHRKKFLIIGNTTAITYKEIYPLIKNNRLWLGVSSNNSTSSIFIVPENYESQSTFYTHNNKFAKINNALWFTNLEHNKRYCNLELNIKYTAEHYPHYDNYDAIDVAKISEIPMDYDGVMGVPISFLHKYNPDQFEIVGISFGWDNTDYMKKIRTKHQNKNSPTINNKAVYTRVFIKHKNI